DPADRLRPGAGDPVPDRRHDPPRQAGGRGGMSMRVLYGAGPADIAGYDTERLRAEFLIGDLFVPGFIAMVYTHVDRMIVGGAVPQAEPLRFGDGADVGTPHFFTAREMGIANLGGAGSITVDGTRFELANRDVLYVGRGAKEVELASA